MRLKTKMRYLITLIDPSILLLVVSVITAVAGLPTQPATDPFELQHSNRCASRDHRYSITTISVRVVMGGVNKFRKIIISLKISRYRCPAVFLGECKSWASSFYILLIKSIKQLSFLPFLVDIGERIIQW